MFLCLRIYDAHARSFALRRIVGNAVNDAVRPDRQLSCLRRGGQRRIQTAEIGLRDAAAVADATIMASSTPFVYARKYSRAANGHDAIVKMFCERCPHILLNASHLHRREKFS